MSRIVAALGAALALSTLALSFGAAPAEAHGYRYGQGYTSYYVYSYRPVYRRHCGYYGC